MTTFHSYEDELTEFKRQLTDTLEKEVIAFLNSDKGGDIYIGVDDDGTLVGHDAHGLAVQPRETADQVLGVARLAGIMGAKRTSDLIPLCHPLPITKVALDMTPDATLPGIRITATVKTTGQTGVEMEALTAASTAALTVYDMAKAVDKAMEIGGLHVVLKDGGKSGRYEAS